MLKSDILNKITHFCDLTGYSFTSTFAPGFIYQKYWNLFKIYSIILLWLFYALFSYTPRYIEPTMLLVIYKKIIVK